MEVEMKGVRTAQLQKDKVCRHEGLTNKAAIHISCALQAWNAINLVFWNSKIHTYF
jgi:hypothetical protein